MKDKRRKLRRRTDTLLLKDFKAHIQADAESFGRMNDLLSKTATKDDISKLREAIEPMLKVFNENKIVRMKLGADFKGIVLYSAGITTIGAAFYGIVYWGRIIFMKLFL